MKTISLPDILIMLALSLMFLAGFIAGGSYGARYVLALIAIGAGAAALAVAMLSAPDVGEGEAVDNSLHEPQS